MKHILLIHERSSYVFLIRYSVTWPLLSVGSNISTWSPTSRRVCLAYYNVSCNVSETSVVLPGPASMNPPNIHITL